MHFDCAISVYDEFEKAAESVRAVKNSGISDGQVTFEMHDVAAEVPDAQVIESGDQENVVFSEDDQPQHSDAAAELSPLATSDEGTAAEVGGINKLGEILKMFSQASSSLRFPPNSAPVTMSQNPLGIIKTLSAKATC